VNLPSPRSGGDEELLYDDLRATEAVPIPGEGIVIGALELAAV